MIKNYLKISFRNLLKNKVYATINILGLTLGVAATLLIYHMTTYELSFNKNFEGYQDIYRVVQIDRSSDDQAHSVCVPIPAMDVMEDRVSQFSEMTRVRELWGSLTVPNPDGGAPLKKFRTDDDQTAFFAEPSFLKIFKLEWLAGDASKALDNPGSIILSRTWAEKCFDNWEKAMGETIFIDNIVPVEVKGIIEDLPANSDFPLPFIISYQTVKNHADLFLLGDSWGACSSNDQVFALLSDKSSVDAANAVLNTVGKDEYANESGIQERTHYLQPLADLHYDERYGHSGSHHISMSRIKVLGFVGILILVIACFNFINLATAQSITRAKEVGIRKTLGSTKRQLIYQFLVETGLIVFAAIFLGSYLAQLCTPLLRHVSYVPSDVSIFQDPSVAVFLVLVALGVTSLSGLYPAMALANYKPVRALSNRVVTSSGSGVSLRNSLVVLQFGVAMTLVISTIIALDQLNYIRNRDLGFDQNLIYNFSFNNDEKTVARQEALRGRLARVPGVTSVSLSSDQPMSGDTWSSNFRYAERPEDERVSMTLKFCDDKYLDTYRLELVAGKFLDPSDTMRQCVINALTLKMLGVENPQEALGQNIRLGGRTLLPIVGVVKDFNAHSLHEANQPLLMTTRKVFYWEAGLKISPDNIKNTTAEIKNAFDEIMPEQVFDGGFLDEDMAQYYEGENRLANSCKAFGLLAILISCLGLFGLASHTVKHRMKEIGVRKVLGATVPGIVGLLSRDFLKLVLLAMIVASPVAWYVMNKWLQEFAFRINIELWVFLVAGVLAVTIAFITVSYQSIKAALANPIDSIRTE